MAFNPFHAFRKHQKVFFAALTIICMLTFVMASGSFAGGDFFSELTRWVTGRSRTHEIAVVYGKRITDREIFDLKMQRRLANQFVLQSVLQAQEIIFNDAQNSLTQFDQAAQNQVQEILSRRRFAAFMPREYLNNLRVYLLQLQIMERQLDTAKKPELVTIVRQLQSALQRDYWLFHSPKDELYPDENLYFGGSLTSKGLVDFIVWLHQADRLGITLVPDDIIKEYQHEALGRSANLDTRRMLIQLGFQPTQQALLKALGDEFRVRMAQAALVGYNPGGIVGQVPVSVTPYEFWEYYRTNRTELSLKLLPIPVQKFIPEVKDKPSEGELEALFEKYKDQEYAPDKETPGFKQPRRIKLEWVSASPDSDYYRKQAQECLLGVLAATPANPFLPMALLDPIVSEYETMKYRHFRASGLLAADFANAFHDHAYFERAENVAAIVGQITGMVAGQANALSPAVAFRSASVARTEKEFAAIVASEGQRRLPLAAAVFATGTSIQPILALAGTLKHGSAIEQYLPMSLVKEQVVQKVRENVAHTLLTVSLDAFKTELETIRKEVEAKKVKPAEVEKRVEKAVAEHGWAHGAMSEPQDQYQINRDAKELTLLKEAYSRSPQYRDTKAKQFAQNLFFRDAPDRWKLFTPQELAASPGLDTSARKTFLYWKTDDQPAKVFSSLVQARSQVESAWRLEKARELAKAKALELAKQAHETHGDYLRTLTEASATYGTIFELTGVARWAKPALSSRPDAFAQYQPYTVADDKIEYPPIWPSFVDPLLERLKEPGDTTVISNRPKDIYYVVALERRDAPSMPDFYKETAGNRGLLLGQLEFERQTAYRLSFMAQLRQEAHLTINEEGVQERPSLPAED